MPHALRDVVRHSHGHDSCHPRKQVAAGDWPQPSPACVHDPDDHTFDVLLDTCGVPSIVLQIVMGVFLTGATLLLLGADGVALPATRILDPLSYLFNAADEVGVLVR